MSLMSLCISRLLGSGVPFDELALDVGEGHTHLFEQDEIVIHEVGGFVDEAVAVAVDSFDGRLYGFLAHFLRYLFDSFDKEACGVGVFGHFFVASGYERGERTYETVFGGGVETCRGAAVTCGPDGTGFDEKGVHVAVGIHLHDAQVVA